MMNKEFVISSGNVFLVSDTKGDIGTEDYHGIFSADVRHLSKLLLRINNAPLELLTSRETAFDSAMMVLTNRTAGDLEKFDLTVIRKRTIANVFNEDIEIVNNTKKKLKLIISLQFDADFSDIFEIKSLIHEDNAESLKKRSIKTTFHKKTKQLIFNYTRKKFIRTTVIHFNEVGDIKKRKAHFVVTLLPNQNFNFSYYIAFLVDKKAISITKIQRIKEKYEVLKERQLSKIKIKTNWDDFNHVLTKSVSDLDALRIYQEKVQGKTTWLSAAGIPWFMAIFGRDSLITAYQTIILGSDSAIGTLRFLAKYQGKELNPLREEQPGKILHEMRFGEAAYFRDWVHFPYYGTIDATPLFLILLSEVYRFGASKKFIHEMKGPALAALSWINQYGDADQDGFVEYKRMSLRGLENQNWRDSWDSMVFRNGKLAVAPIASSDVQGYVYDAKIRLAEIAKDVWKDFPLAIRLEEEGRALKKQFNEEFWIKKKGYFALGLDKDKKPIDSLSSSIGHLLWSGIVDEEKIPSLVKHLESKFLYSGWGVRTISSKDKGYNPLIYHRGTVWPHDNSLIAAGLMKAGYNELALRIIDDLVTASSFFNYRLPEVFAGFDRHAIPFPVKYPTSASPQAWAAATPILFLRLLLGIEPDKNRKKILINPALPNKVDFITLEGIAAFRKLFSVNVSQKSSSVNEIKDKK